MVRGPRIMKLGPWTLDRGYHEALAEHDLAEALIWDCADTKRDASEAMVEFCKTYPEVTAIVCNGDRVALGASLSLAHQDKQAGREISIIGIDDISDAALANPPLSTMAVSPTELGQQLGRVMINRLKHPNQQKVNLDITAELIVRKTTDVPLKRQ